MHTFQIGDWTVGRVAELEFPAFDARHFFPAATAEMVDEARSLLPGRIDAQGRIVMSFHSFVIRTARHVILVDACCGADKPRPGRDQFNTGRMDYLGGLARLGVAPEAVTHVLCTHLHWDHVGWNTRLVDGRWVPTFPNAQYVVAKREYDWWDAELARAGSRTDNVHLLGFADSVLPVMRAGKVVLVADDHQLDDGLWLEPCHGHSPGHVVLNAERGGIRVAFIGDVIHHPMQLLFPELSSMADLDMNASRVSRRALMERHAGTGTIVAPAHFASPTCGHIRRSGAAFRFDFLAGS